jgi:uncharacterized protein
MIAKHFQCGWILALGLLISLAEAAFAEEFAPDSLTNRYFYDAYDDATLRRAIAAGASVTETDTFGATPLMTAIFNGPPSAVGILLDAGADVAARDKNDNTALHAAAFRQDISAKLVTLLIKSPGFVPDLLNVQNNYGMTPLMIALTNSQIEAATLLIEAGSDVTLKTPQGKTALDFAKERNASGIVSLITKPVEKPAAKPVAKSVVEPVAKPAAKAAPAAKAPAATANPTSAFTIPDYPRIASDMLSGKPYDFDDVSQAVTAGAASALLEECRVDLSMAERLEVVDFVKSATLAAALGSDFSNPDMTKTWSSQHRGMAQYTAGVTAVRTMGCSGDLPSNLARSILEAVRFNREGSGNGAVFLDSCSRRHGAGTCGCVLTQGMALDANLADKVYSQDLIYGLLERNPMIGLVMITQCGLTEY